MNSLQTINLIFTSKMKQNKNCVKRWMANAPESHLKLGAPFVLTHVEHKPGWYRSLKRKVASFDLVGNKVVRVAYGNEKSVPRASRSVSVLQGCWPMVTRSQLPLTFGWAVATHKAEGLSLETSGAQVSDVFAPEMG